MKNNWDITGRIITEVLINHYPDGTPVANTLLSHNEYYDNAVHKRVLVGLRVFGTEALEFSNKVKNNDLITVSGRLSIDKEGKLSVLVKEFTVEPVDSKEFISST